MKKINFITVMLICLITSCNNTSINMYNITFDSAGSSTFLEQNVYSGSLLEEPIPNPERTGYVFLGWYLSTLLEEKWDFNANPVISNITLVARWVPEIQVARWPFGKVSAVSFTWDDNNSTHTKIAEVFDRYEYKTSFFVNPKFNSWLTLNTMYKEIVLNGHEVGNHTFSHPDLTTLSSSELAEQIAMAHDVILNDLLTKPTAFVHPFNKTNEIVDEEIFARYPFTRIRSRLNEDHRKILNVDSTTNSHALISVIESSLSNRQWLIVAGHGLGESGYGPITETTLDDALSWISKNNDYIYTGTLSDIANYEFLLASTKLHLTINNDQVLIDINDTEFPLGCENLNPLISVIVPSEAVPFIITEDKINSTISKYENRDTLHIITVNLKITNRIEINK